MLPTSQRQLWPELVQTPRHFTLYGATALALWLAHCPSLDFDFFSNEAFDPDALAREIDYLAGSERVQVAANTLTCRVDRNGPVLVSFFGDLRLGQVAPHDPVKGMELNVASILDLGGTKAAVVQKSAEVKDYLDIDALIAHGVSLPTLLAAARIVYGPPFNPLIPLKALSYFDDLPTLSRNVRARLSAAVAAVDPAPLPTLTAYRPRPGDRGRGS